MMHGQNVSGLKPSRTTSPSRGCRTCMNLYDNRYCTKWRDVVPDEAQEHGCEEIDQYPPF